MRIVYALPFQFPGTIINNDQSRKISFGYTNMPSPIGKDKFDFDGHKCHSCTAIIPTVGNVGARFSAI